MESVKDGKEVLICYFHIRIANVVIGDIEIAHELENRQRRENSQMICYCSSMPRCNMVTRCFQRNFEGIPTLKIRFHLHGCFEV